MSYEIREQVPHQVQLSAAILLYGKAQPYSSSLRADFATVHPVTTLDDGRPVIGAGAPIDQRNLAALAHDLAGRTRMGHGLLPPEVLSIGNDHIVWWLPPTRRAVFFQCDGKDQVGTRSGGVPTPGLVFVARSRQLFAYAVKGAARPEAGTALFHAPFLNIWASGQVCTGSTPLPDENVVATMKRWTDGFFGSSFTHTNHPRSVRFEGGAHAFWTAMLDGQFKTFPEKVLVRRAKESVGSLIGRIEEGGFGDAS